MGDEGELVYYYSTRSGIGRAELDIVSNEKLVSGSFDGFNSKSMSCSLNRYIKGKS